MRAERCAFLVAVCLSGAAWAAEPPADLQLLEFLGEFTTDDGEWIDPMALGGSDESGLREEALESEAGNAQDKLGNRDPKSDQ